MKKLSEKQAWLAIAKQCDKPKRDANGIYFIQPLTPDDWCAYGVCTAVENYSTDDAISHETEDRMMEKLRRHLPEKRFRLSKGWDDEFCWPHTLRGWKSRAAFCRRMAKLCGKGKGK